MPFVPGCLNQTSKADLGPWSPKKVRTPTCLILLRPNMIYKWDLHQEDLRYKKAVMESWKMFLVILLGGIYETTVVAEPNLLLKGCGGCGQSQDTCEMQFTDDQDPSCSVSKQTQDAFIEETSALSSSGTESCLELNQIEPRREFYREEIGIKHLVHGMRPQEHKRKMVKDKGSSTILRFFQSSNNSSSSSSPKQEHVRTIDETKASSSSNFQSISSCSEPIEAELPKENVLEQTGTQSVMSTLGRDDMRRDAWDYKIDEIDPTVVNELPPEIQEEVQAWLRPQKRANVSKRGSSIAHYFLPTKNT